MEVMTNKELVEKVIDIANNYKTLYVLGCFGAPMNAYNKKRYINKNAYNKGRANIINKATDDTFGFDCVNLIKGILWGWSGNKNATYGGATYKANGVPDTNANGMFNDYCYDKTNDFSNIEIGEFVWTDGHIGVAIGNGLAVECTPLWQNKVQITAIGNIGKKDGYNTRTWKSHGKSVFIKYEDTKYVNIPPVVEKKDVYKDPELTQKVSTIKPKKYNGLSYKVLGTYPNGVVKIPSVNYGEVYLSLLDEQPLYDNGNY